MGLLQRSNRSWLHLPKRWALRRGAPGPQVVKGWSEHQVLFGGLDLFLHRRLLCCDLHTKREQPSKNDSFTGSRKQFEVAILTQIHFQSIPKPYFAHIQNWPPIFISVRLSFTEGWSKTPPCWSQACVLCSTKVQLQCESGEANGPMLRLAKQKRGR